MQIVQNCIKFDLFIIYDDWMTLSKMTAPISPGYLQIICFSSKPSLLLNATIEWTQSDIGLVWVAGSW